MVLASANGRGNQSALFPASPYAAFPEHSLDSDFYIALLEEEGLDHATLGHCKRVMELSSTLGQDLGYLHLDELKKAALLHDVGKIHLPQDLLHSPHHPTRQGWALIHSHPKHGVAVLRHLQGKGIPIPKEAYAAALYHHENQDGSGYPYKMVNGNIPFCATIVQAADVYDALTSLDRDYRKPLGKIQALEEMASVRHHFHPKVFSALVSSIGGKEYASQLMHAH